MTQVNLLPPELRQRQAARRTTAIVIGAGVMVLLLVGFFYFLQTLNLSRAEDDLAAQQATNSQLEGQIAELQKYEQLQNQLQQKEQLLHTVYQDEINWSGVLLDVSRVIPANAYLTNFTGQVTAGQAPAAGGTTSALVGNMTFAGQAAGTDTLASWLTKLDQVKGWTNAWMSSANESAPFSGNYTFNSGVDLTSDALTARGRGGQQ